MTNVDQPPGEKDSGGSSGASASTISKNTKTALYVVAGLLILVALSQLG